MANLRKRPLILKPDPTPPSSAGEIDIATVATVALSSEDPANPVDNMLDGRSGAGATRWTAAQANTIERIDFEFDEPQTISRVLFDVEESRCSRTQEIRIDVSRDRGTAYRQVLMQQYSFSPAGATYQSEDIRFALAGVTNFRVTIVPNQSGSGTASITSLRLFR